MTPIPKQGARPKRRARRMREYWKIRRWVLDRSEGRCEAKFSNLCRGRASQAHHVLPRSQGGDDTPGNLLAVCVACHAAIHDFPLAARKGGLLRRLEAS